MLLHEVELDLLRHSRGLETIPIIGLLEADLIVADLAIRSIQAHRAALIATAGKGVEHV